MIPGPEYVYKCPNCDNFLTKGSLVSGNTFGEKMYSDGKRIAPMLPEFPNLTKCKKCSAIFWLSKLQKLGTYDEFVDENPTYKNADEAKFLKIEDYFQALNKGIAENNDEELTIRQFICWSYNDRVRNNKAMFIDEEDELKWEKNTKALMSLLEAEYIDSRILLAELNRNLGNFETCIGIIKDIDNEELSWLKEIFLTECERKNKLVVQLY